MNRCLVSPTGSRDGHQALRRRIPGGTRVFALALMGTAIWLCTAAQVLSDQPATPLVVKAPEIHIGDGRCVENGIVVIEGGRIRAVGQGLSVPENATVIAVDGGSVTPGLIDANARVESADLIAPSRRRPDSQTGHLRSSPAAEYFKSILRRGLNGREADAESSQLGTSIPGREAPYQQSASDTTLDEGSAPLAVGVRTGAVVTEQGSEVVPHTRVLDSLDLRSPDFVRLVRGGVTTAYVSPDASAVIGARGAVVHTAGPLDQRVLVQAAAVKAVIGSEPSFLGSYNRSPYRTSVSFYTRRPSSRMGLTWVFRKAFYDAMRRGEGLDVYGADTASPQASAVLRDVLAGEVPLRIQARIQQDILTALRLAKEFDLRFTLEEATEAYRCLDELRSGSVAVVFGPIYERPEGIRLRSGEARRSRYSTFRALLEAGIETALSAQELREEDGLARQAMYAVRFGVALDDALRAVTQTPARLLGLDEQLGTLQPDKRADLVVWSGRPFAAVSMPVVVVIDGKIVVDRR